jgi:hypothetical protein
MVGKDKTTKAPKGKAALEREFQAALAAADEGTRFTAVVPKKEVSGPAMSPHYQSAPKPTGENTCEEDEMPQLKGAKKGAKRK